MQKGPFSILSANFNFMPSASHNTVVADEVPLQTTPINVHKDMMIKDMMIDGF